MTKISVIIPVYNTANYLNECLDSVLNQTLEDIEVICVNDGSTDSSLEILEIYAIKDKRVKIINQKNKGLGAARNIALDLAKGEYIFFLDSDDYIDEYALEDLYDLASRKHLDLLIFKLINFDNETYKESKALYFEMNFMKRLVGDEIFNWHHVKTRLFDMAVTAPGKLFRHDMIKNIRFPENLIFEDSLFFIKMIFKAKRIFFYDNHLYHRRIRHDSIMTSSFKEYPDCITIYDLIGEHLKRIGHYHDFSDQLFNRKCKDIFTRFSNVPVDFKEDFYLKIKDNFLKNSNSLQKDGTLKICAERSLAIFKSAIKSNSYPEFELSVNVFDLKRDCDKLKLDKSMIRREYENKIAKLNNENKEYQIEIDLLRNSSGLKISKFFGSIADYIKRLIGKIL